MTFAEWMTGVYEGRHIFSDVERALAAAFEAGAAAERERRADKVMLKNLALMACASLLERVEIADGGTYGDLPETAAGVAEALRA